MPATGRVTIRRRNIAATTLPSSLHPVLRRVYAGRGVTSGSELDLSLAALPDPDGLAGCSGAAARLADAVRGGERVVVIGDYDADGATSSALAVAGLRALGAREPTFLVPNRFTRGYGLTPEVVEDALHLAPDLLLTVDNGIASIDGVAAARAHGIDVVVTDHHLPGDALPAATAIVNPQLGPAAFPARELAGVGVLFYLLLATRRVLRDGGWFAARPEPNLADHLDLVAVGTVADMVRLDRVNRTLVQHGLHRIRKGAARPGIAALLDAAGRDPRHVSATDIGFTVGPRINAAGRLADMTLGVQCLLADGIGEATRLAHELDALNRERRTIEQQMRDQATRMLERLAVDESTLPAGLCLYDPEWHQGVVGILAGRVKERLHRPVIAFAPADGGLLRGSARSVAGIHLRDALQAIHDAHPELLQRFGGHAMAAGLTLRADDYALFAEAFATQITRQATPELLHATLDSDGPLASAELSLETAAALESGGPWGQGFPEPLFDGRFTIVERRVVGERHLQLRLHPPGGGQPVGAIAFHAAEVPGSEAGCDVDIAYRASINRFRGDTRLQLVVEHLTAAPPGVADADQQEIR